MDSSSNTKKVAWNASQGIIMEISNRRTLANTYYIGSDIKKAFNTLIAIKQSVIQSFNDDERTKLSEIEIKFNQASIALHSSISSSFNPPLQQAFKLSMTLSKKLYSQYNDLLMDLLDSRGYLIGEQSDASSMKF